MQTMGEFTSISDSLALMADPALQQFAQMHKDDPFSLALAVSESNRRKKLRAAQQGVAGMQQQPPVADQEIAQMNAPVMPESVGIGALPAPSMAGMPMGGITGEEEMEPQTMAGGGMVAFRDGGDVERYQSGGGFGSVKTTIGTSAEDLALDELRIQDLLRERAEDARISALVEGRAVPPAPPAPPVRSPAGFTRPGMANDPRLLGSTPPGETVGYAGERARNMALVNAAPTTARPPAAPPRPAAAAAPRPAAAAVPGIGGLDAAAEYEKALKAAEAKPDPNAADVKALGEERVKVGQESVTGLEAIQKQFSDIFKGRKERLDTREAEVGKLKDQGLGLALLQAGAAMMTTRGGLGVALGKGVQVGTEQYASGLEKLRSAQEKIADARDRLEEIEAQRGELSARELFKARNEVKNLGINAREDLIKSRMLSTKENRETAMKVVDSTLRLAGTREEITARKDVAAMEAASRAAAAARNPQLELLEKLGAAPPDSALAKGFELSKQEGLIPRLYEQYTKQATDSITGPDFVRKFPTFEAYRAGMGGANQRGIIPGVPSNAAVRAP